MSRRLLDGKHPKPKKGANPGGRPTKFEIDQELMNRLRNALLLGAPVVTAAALNDISYDTLRSWVVKGKEKPDSQYGALIRMVYKATSEWEIRDLSAWDAHITGRPAQYLMEPMVDKDGQPHRDENNKIVMQVVKDPDGRPIIKAAEIKPDWRAAMERLARRKSKTWASKVAVDIDAVMTFDNKEREVNPKEAMTFEQRIADAVRELEDEV